MSGECAELMVTVQRFINNIMGKARYDIFGNLHLYLHAIRYALRIFRSLINKNNKNKNKVNKK